MPRNTDAIVRKPAVAGMFYDADAASLRQQLSSFFANAKAKPTCIGVISPHAGYVYSGRTAAWAIASLKTAKTFIILGPNHNGIGPEFSCFASGSWQTPLGKLDVDEHAAKRLAEQCKFLRADAMGHMMEHSIEVQLPFLQHRFGSFGIVPISVMNAGYGREFLGKCIELGKAIATVSRENVETLENSLGIVASSDFSHYLPKEVADKKDGMAVEKIIGLNVNGFFKTLEDIDASVCGFGPIAVLMSAARQLGLKAKLVNKSTSGDATGDYSSVVAYYAIGFY